MTEPAMPDADDPRFAIVEHEEAKARPGPTSGNTNLAFGPLDDIMAFALRFNDQEIADMARPRRPLLRYFATEPKR